MDSTDAASGADYGVDSQNQHSGTSAFFFAGVTSGSYDATTPGQFYTLTFWLNLIYDDPAGVDAAHPFPYKLFTFNSLQATGSSTVLKFDG